METTSIQEGSGPLPPVRDPYPLLPLERFLNECIPPARRGRTRIASGWDGMEVYDRSISFQDWIADYFVPLWAKHGDMHPLLGPLILQLMLPEELQTVIGQVPGLASKDSVFWIRHGHVAQAQRMAPSEDPVSYEDIVIAPRFLVDMCAKFTECGVLGSSPAMIRTYVRNLEIADYINAQSAIDDTNILITGEIGSGKDLLAGAMHKILERKSLVPINCGAFASHATGPV